MNLPQYFQPGETSHEFYHSVGDRVYGTLIVRGVEVEYRFNDGTRPHTEVKEFPTESQAQRFATKFAAEMNRCNKRNTVPMLSTFRNF